MEALLYYDTVLLNIGNQPQFAEFVGWFIDRHLFADLLALLHDGTVSLYDYGFFTAPVLADGVYSVWNIQDPIQMKPDTFIERFVEHEAVTSRLGNPKDVDLLARAIEGRVIEEKSADFGPAIENVKADLKDRERMALVMQSFLDNLYEVTDGGIPPEVKVSVTSFPTTGRHRIDWGVNLEEVKTLAGKLLNFHPGVPLAGAAVANRLLFSSIKQRCDLFLPRPLSLVVGDKLFETAATQMKMAEIIENLQERVDFPDVEALVNKGTLSFYDVLDVRNEAKRFREWLQTETERDRDAIIAYHHEVAEKTKLDRLGSKILRLFGVLSGGAIGGGIGTITTGDPWLGGTIGAAASESVSYVSQFAKKLGEDWKPVVFGRWFNERIKKLTERKTKRMRRRRKKAGGKGTKASRKG